MADKIDIANEIIKWFNSHSYARGLLCDELRSLEQPELQLIAACLTRWTAHICAIKRLLQVELALKSLVLKRRDKLIESVGKKAKLRSKAIRIMDYIQDPHLWSGLTM